MSNGIGANPLNAISKVYLEQIAEKKDDSYLETDMKKRQKNNEKARKDMEKMGTSMKNPHFEEKQQGWDVVNSLADAYKAMQKEGYGAPGHNPGSGEKSVARAKALMDKQGRKGAPGLDAMAAAKKEHEARRGVKKEEVEVEEGYDEPKMHSAVKRVMTTQPAAKGRAASRLHSKYSMRSKGNVAGETDGPGPNAPKRSGRKGRGSETDRGSGNAAKRRMSTEGLDPVGREDGDVNNDGKKDGTDKYLMNRRKAIGKAIKKKMSEGVRDIDPEKGTAERKARLEKKRGMKLDDHPQFKKEEFIPEVMSDDMDDKPIKEKKVKNVVKINPKLGESVEEIGGELIEAVEIFDILEEITDQELRFISDRMIDEIVEEFFLEAAEQDEDLEVLQQNLCESIDLSISLLLEQDAGAEARKRLGSGPSRASVIDRVKSAVKKHGPTVKAGLKKAGKAAARGAGYAAGAAVRGAKAAGREFSKGYERGRTGSSGSSDSSSSSSDSGSSSSSNSGSSSAPKKPGLLSRIGAKLKKGIGKAARAVSRGARNVARKMDEAVYGGTPEKKKDTRMVVTAADKKGNTPAYQRMKAGDKRYKAADHMNEVYKGKHGQTDKQYADSRSQGGKMVSGDSKMSGAEYTHGRRVKAANPGMQPDVGGKTKPKSQGKMDKGTRADLEYRKANLRKEEASDAMKDRRMERGGVGGNVDYKKAPKFTSGPKKKYDGMSALEFVKADIRKKHGKGAIIDTKKK